MSSSETRNAHSVKADGACADKEHRRLQVSRRDCLLNGGAVSVHALLQPYGFLAETALTTKDRAATRPHQLTVPTASLEIAYEESGPAYGPSVVLLHGFPYDVRQYDDVRMKLATSGHRVLVPYLRGFGDTRYRNERVFRSGQQAALGKDVIDFLDALQIPQAILVGYDWGGRAACVAAALWPARVLGLVSCSGYAIQDIVKAASEPASPDEVYRRWYALYFNTEMGRAGLAHNRKDFCRFLWQLWSPTWHFNEADYQETSLSFDNPDFVATAIHQYRHRYGNAPGDPDYEDLEVQLSKQPLISVPTFVLSGGKDGVEPPAAEDLQRQRFTGYYRRRIVPEVGHCVPAESPNEVVAAVTALIKPGSI